MGGAFSSTPTSEVTLDSLSADLSSGRFRNVVVMCGAGISTAAGVPDFRTPSAGLYFKLRKFNLPYPEAIFSASYFNANPRPFYELVRDIYPERLCPTKTHKFFTLLQQKGILSRVYTQNIDALEFLAGLPEDKVVEAHGTFQRSYCVNRSSCGSTFDLPWLKSAIFSPQTNEGVPKCPKCNSVVRPDVVLFGEALPQRFWNKIGEDFGQCDLLLIFGTSLTVAPFNSLIAKPGRNAVRAYVNRTKPGASGFVGFLLGLSRSINFDKQNDMIHLGDCDDFVEKVCNKANWKQELDNIEVTVMEP